MAILGVCYQALASVVPSATKRFTPDYEVHWIFFLFEKKERKTYFDG